jgi:hypothetical protein
MSACGGSCSSVEVQKNGERGDEHSELELPGTFECLWPVREAAFCDGPPVGRVRRGQAHLSALVTVYTSRQWMRAIHRGDPTGCVFS